MKLDRIDYNGGDIWVDKEAECPKGSNVIFPNTSNGVITNYEGCEVKVAQWDYAANGNSNLLVVAQSITNPSYIDGVPFVEVVEDVEQLVKDYARDMYGNNNTGNYYNACVADYKAGYKAAQTKQFTEEDLRNAIDMAREREEDVRGHSEYGYHNKYSDADIINSLKPKVDSIEIETEPNLTQEWGESTGLGTVEVFWKEDGVKPKTYQKDGKTFLTVKKVNYETRN